MSLDAKKIITLRNICIRAYGCTFIEFKEVCKIIAKWCNQDKKVFMQVVDIMIEHVMNEYIVHSAFYEFTIGPEIGLHGKFIDELTQDFIEIDDSLMRMPIEVNLPNKRPRYTTALPHPA